MAFYCVPEKGKAALLTISAQRDFTQPGSPIKVCGFERKLPAMRGLIQGFRDSGLPIFHSIRLYRADGSNVDACRRQAIEEGLRILMPGSLGSELIDELKPAANDRLDPSTLLDGKFQRLGANEWAFYRPRWGAFHGTSLEARLKEQGVTTLVICGFSFATGTRATVYEASARDFRIIVIPDAVCGATDESLEELGRMGVYMMTSDNCLVWKNTAPAAPTAT